MIESHQVEAYRNQPEEEGRESLFEEFHCFFIWVAAKPLLEKREVIVVIITTIEEENIIGEESSFWNNADTAVNQHVNVGI